MLGVRACVRGGRLVRRGVSSGRRAQEFVGSAALYVSPLLPRADAVALRATRKHAWMHEARQEFQRHQRDAVGDSAVTGAGGGSGSGSGGPLPSTAAPAGGRHPKLQRVRSAGVGRGPARLGPLRPGSSSAAGGATRAGVAPEAGSAAAAPAGYASLNGHGLGVLGRAGDVSVGAGAAARRGSRGSGDGSSSGIASGSGSGDTAGVPAIQRAVVQLQAHVRGALTRVAVAVAVRRQRIVACHAAATAIQAVARGRAVRVRRAARRAAVVRRAAEAIQRCFRHHVAVTMLKTLRQQAGEVRVCACVWGGGGLAEGVILLTLPPRVETSACACASGLARGPGRVEVCILFPPTPYRSLCWCWLAPIVRCRLVCRAAAALPPWVCSGCGVGTCTVACTGTC